MRSRILASIAAVSLLVGGPAQAFRASTGSEAFSAAEASQNSEQLEDGDDTLIYILGGIGLLLLVYVAIDTFLDNDTNAEPQPGPPISP
jgi:hypothetical protein